MIFIGAFVSGAILWAIWMYFAVEKARLTRPDNSYLIPNAAPTSPTPPPVVSNAVPTPASSAQPAN